MSWGTSLLIICHYINWLFDPNLFPAPPLIPLSNLQPKCLSVHNCLILLEGLTRNLEAFWKSKIRCHHTSLFSILMKCCYLAWFLSGLIDGLLHCCDCYWWSCSLLSGIHCLFWSGGFRWGRNLRDVCGRGRGGTGKGKWALSSACLCSISVSMSQMLTWKHKWKWELI